MSDVASRIADFVVACNIKDQAVEQKARILLCDALVLGAMARHVEGVPQTLDACSSDTGGSTRWIDGECLPLLDAVFANCFSVHSRFQDDCEMSSWTHPASIVVPVAVAATEIRHGSLGDVLASVVAGYAVAHWLGAEGVVAHSLIDRGFRPSPAFGPMMACATAARATGSSVEECADGLRAAALLARGTVHSVASGGTDWRLQNATAAIDGLLAAKFGSSLAGSGVASIESEHGFLGVYAGLDSQPEHWASPPTERSVLTVWHKPAPTLGDNVAAYVAAASIAGSVAPSDVEFIEVEVHEDFVHYPGTQQGTPFETSVSAIASMRYAVARGLVSGGLRWEHYADEQRNDPVVGRIVDAIEVRGRSDFAHTDATVRVQLRDGSNISTSADDQDLATLLFRTPDEALRSAERLLGADGVAMAESVLEDSLDTRVSKIVAAVSQRSVR